MLNGILKRHRLKFGFTFLLVLAEAAAGLLFPLFIGLAVDDAIVGSDEGVVKLGLLGLVALLIGTGRRFFDSRFYSQIYQELGLRIISKMENASTSVKSARLGMIGELVEFLENALPELINALIGLAGVIIMIAMLNLKVFYGSLIVTFLIFLIYWMSASKTIRLNRAMNDEQEKQVAVISRLDSNALATHLTRTMRWNIKLSDLEAVNFSASWVLLIGFLVVTILLAANEGVVKYGAMLSLIMYVFQFMESITNLPFFYQSWLRLKEMCSRF